MKFKLATVLLAVIIIGIFSTNISYAAKSSYNDAITVDPISFLVWNVLNLTYEQKLNQTNSFTIKGAYFSYNDWTYLGIGGSYRWYYDLFKTRQKPLEGFAVGPKAMLNYWMTDFAGLEGGTTVNIGGEAIYKWVWDGFALEVGINLDFYLLRIDDYSDYTPFSTVINVGYAW